MYTNIREYVGTLDPDGQAISAESVVDGTVPPLDPTYGLRGCSSKFSKYEVHPPVISVE